jgi:hypothetical protein
MLNIGEMEEKNSTIRGIIADILASNLTGDQKVTIIVAAMKSIEPTPYYYYYPWQPTIQPYVGGTSTPPYSYDTVTDGVVHNH